MKFGILGDLHLTDKTPKHRIDNYPETQKEKLNWCLSFFKDNEVNYILQPGDFFDSHKANDYIKQSYIRFFKQFGIPILTVYGQHDLRFHSSNKENTPLAVTEAADIITILDEHDYPIRKHPNIPSEARVTGDIWIKIFGASWGEGLPDPPHTPQNTTILVTHKMVILDKKVWEGQEDYTTAKVLLKKTHFDLIVTGDNHQAFWYKEKDRSLLNCGSLMRATTTQINHKPCIFIYDTSNKVIEHYEIPIKPIEEVMDLSEVKEEKQKNEELEAFISGLKDEVQIEGLDFKRNLQSHLKKNKVENGVKSIIEEVLNG